MSDGSLSQDELEALLGGSGEESVVPPVSTSDKSASESESIDPEKKSQLLALYSDLIPVFSASLSDVMSQTVVISQPEIVQEKKEIFLSSLPNDIVTIQNNYIEGLSGEHLYIISKEDALKIASPMMGQEKLEINGASVGAVSEAISHMANNSVKTIGERIQTSVIAEDPAGIGINKAEFQLTGDAIVHIQYQMRIENEGEVQIEEIFSHSLIEELADRLRPEKIDSPILDSTSETSEAARLAELAGISDPTESGGDSGFNINVDDLLGGEGGESVMPGLGISGPIGSKPNVQNVQMQNLSPVASSGETRNISMLMDVSMEMTVELGRTKWKIREILNIGEGTIIELEKLAGEPVDILVNGNYIAKGEVVVIDENFGVRVTEILSTVNSVTGN